MKVVICWSHISGYITSCWRALAARGDIDLSIVAFQSSNASTFAFDDSLVSDLRCRLLTDSEQADAGLIRDIVASHRPDVVVIPGWFVPTYVALTRDPKLAGTTFIMTMDTPYKGTLRQKLGRYKIAGLLKRLSGVVVAGERAFQFARSLGVPEQKILRGVYGYDDVPLEKIFSKRLQKNNDEGWPRRFLFVGRYVEDKAIDILVDGYRRYRAMVDEPWPLTCCGRGPLEHLLKGDGITDRGFVPPRDLPDVLLDHGAYVLCSRYEPWGVALAEAMASGLPVIATEACGASVELVRSEFNGLLVPTDDAAALSNAFRRMHKLEDARQIMGQNARPFATAFSAEMWARRWGQLFDRLT